MLRFRTRVGEEVSEVELDATDFGEAALLGEAEVGDGQETSRETGVGGLSANGGVGACSRKEGAAGSWSVGIKAFGGGGMG